MRGPLFFLVPRHADFSSVWIQCDLLKKGTEHPEACAKNVHDGDPAKRLGIRVMYRSKETSKMETDSDMKKLNSLVDFLDGENEKYIANQPLHFLAQKKGKNGRPAMYT